MSAILELRGVSKQFAKHRALNDVSLAVPRGAFFSLLGPSGCGKTTALRLIAGFETPTSGEVWLNGTRIDHLPPYRRNVNTVFQSYALFPHLDVRGNIEFGLRRGLPKNGARDVAGLVRRVLEQVRLAGKESRMPSELSGGERQRVALARALVLAPDVLLLDEPLSALDPLLRKQVRAELKDLQRRVGVTFLFVTHDQEEALSLSDSIAVINRGTVEQVGTPQEVYCRPRSRFVADFLGAMNWFDQAGVRPEATHISRQRPENGACVRSAVVSRAIFLGSVMHIEVALGVADGAQEDESHTAIVQVAPNGECFQAGDQVHLWWNSSDEVRFPQ